MTIEYLWLGDFVAFNYISILLCVSKIENVSNSFIQTKQIFMSCNKIIYITVGPHLSNLNTSNMLYMESKSKKLKVVIAMLKLNHF